MSEARHASARSTLIASGISQVARLFGKQEHHVVDADYFLNDDSHVTEYFCAEEKRIMAGSLEKKVMTSKGIQWQTRFAVLCEDKLAFAKQGPQDPHSQEIVEYVPLFEIESISLDHVHAEHHAKSKPQGDKGPAMRRANAGQGTGLAVVVRTRTIQNRYELLSHFEKHEQEASKAAEATGAADKEGEEDINASSKSQYEWHITISTTDGGHNGGRTFVYRVPPEDSAAWHAHLRSRVADAAAAGTLQQPRAARAKVPVSGREA